MRERGSPADPSGWLRQIVFGDAAAEVWAAHGAGRLGEPWISFERARQLVQAGHQDEAVTIWQQIAVTEGLESRHTLQAWHFLRQAGRPPPADRARLVLGVAVEMPVQKGHDLLVAYRDGSARYLNYSGKAVIWEDRSDADVQAAITTWLAVGQVIADAIGVWDQPSLPPVPAGQARLLMLTPGGHRFGQAPAAALSQDPTAGPFFTAATSVLQLITSRALVTSRPDLLLFVAYADPQVGMRAVSGANRGVCDAAGLLLPPGTVHPSEATGGVSMAWPIFRGLFDDASLFPPASLPMADAVAGHLRHQTAWYREMSGPFVCADTKVTELSAAVTAAGVAELDLALVLPGGATGLDAAVDGVFADPRLRLRAVEVPAATRDDITAAVADVAAALDRIPLAGAAAFIEVPARDFTTAAARAVDDHRYRAKVRTGGTTAQAFPDDQTLANCLVTLARARLAFKCTAGLHHAVRHRAADTGFEHHGFLNVLLAVAAALHDATREQVAAELADRDAARVAAKISNLDTETVSAVRALFTSFGTCSTDEPVNDLVTLGLAGKD